MTSTAPPAYAWDWLARQRLVWQECRRRLLLPERSHSALRMPPTTSRDVPDWASDHPDLVTATAVDESTDERPHRDYRALDTRAEVIAALRADYRLDADVRGVVDAVVGEVAFLGRLDASLTQLGVRSAPRGMRWWWTHLADDPGASPPSGATPTSEPVPVVPLQLRLVDVLAGYGDVSGR